MIASGTLLLKYNYQVANSIPMSIGSSLGTYTLWKIFSIVLVLAGIIVMFGLGDNIMSTLLSPLTNVLNPGS